MLWFPKKIIWHRLGRGTGAQSPKTGLCIKKDNAMENLRAILADPKNIRNWKSLVFFGLGHFYT
jgi:hypothetical protein